MALLFSLHELGSYFLTMQTDGLTAALQCVCDAQ